MSAIILHGFDEPERAGTVQVIWPQEKVWTEEEIIQQAKRAWADSEMPESAIRNDANLEYPDDISKAVEWLDYTGTMVFPESVLWEFGLTE